MAMKKQQVGEHNVYFFVLRRDAITEANAQTKAKGAQHNAVYAREGTLLRGWLVKAPVTGEVFDAQGRVPPEALTLLTVRG
jgi:hypothetical protein